MIVVTPGVVLIKVALEVARPPMNWGMDVNGRPVDLLSAESLRQL